MFYDRIRRQNSLPINSHTYVQNVLHIYSEVACDVNTNHKNHQSTQNIDIKLWWLLGSLTPLLMTVIILINNAYKMQNTH